MMRALWAMIALVVVAVAVWSSAAMAQDKDTSSLKGKPAPEISLQTNDGKDAKLSDQKGKVVLVDMWATWCPPCRKSLPHVQELSANKDLAGKGLVVWAVNSQEDKPTVEKFLKAGNYTFTVPMDKDGKVGETYLVQGIPTTVIVGRDGSVKEVFIGFGPDSAKEVDAAVTKALAEK